MKDHDIASPQKNSVFVLSGFRARKTNGKKLFISLVAHDLNDV